jgi:large subunit ribosomal protein L18
MKHSKKQARLKRATKFRAKNASSSLDRLCVNKTLNHIYAQVISSCGTKTLAQASTLSNKIDNGGNIEAATKIGELVAEAAKKAGVEAVAFDRGGFKYHGRIKALADGARSGGLKF